jgi:hypothetical protein
MVLETSNIGQAMSGVTSIRKYPKPKQSRDRARIRAAETVTVLTLAETKLETMTNMKFTNKLDLQ